MSRKCVFIGCAMLALGTLAAEQYQLKFSRYFPVSSKKYAECVKGFGKTDDIEGHPCLTVDEAYTDPVVIKTPEFLKKTKQGSIRFHYRPNLPEVPKGTSLLLHTLLYSQDGKGNSTLIGINNYSKTCQIPYFLICNQELKLDNYGPYQEYKLIPWRWHMVEISWDQEQMMLIIDGNLSHSRPLKGQVCWGDTISIGGRPTGWPYSASGWISHITFSDKPIVFTGRRPLVMKQEIAGTPRELQRIKDDSKGFFFYYESPKSAVTITVSPSTFKFKKGDLLWVENYDGDSYEIVAPKDQEVVLKGGPSLFNQVMISHTIPNIAKELTFDISQLSTDLTTYQDGLPSGLPGDAWWQEAGTPKGKSGDQVTVQTPVSGDVVIARSQAMPVKAGVNYLASCDYFSEHLQEGNQVYFGIQVKDDDNKSFTRREYVSRRNNSTDGVDMSFNFTIPSDYKNPKCRMMVAASGKPFSVSFRNFDLRPYPQGMYRIPRPLTLEQQKPQITAQEVREMLKTKKPAVPVCKVIEGRNVFTVNGKPVPCVMHYAFPNERGCRQFEEDGIPVQYLYLPSTSGPHRFWLGHDKYDFSVLDRYLEDALRYAPNSHFMLSMGHNPYYGFASMHPDSVSRNSQGEKLLYGWCPGKETPDNPYTIFYLSPAYLEEISGMIRALCKHLQTSPYGKAVMGVHILGGNDGQWFRIGDADRSPDSLKVFRGYLKDLYHGDLMAFRQAWGDDKLTFETAEFPAGSSGTSRYFLSPDKPQDRRASDLYTYRSWCSSEVICRLAKVYKESMKRPFFVSAYYNDTRAKNDSSKDRLINILEDPNIDAISSCIPYGENRNAGSTGHSLTHAGSVDLHGKKWRMELDYRTDYTCIGQRGENGYDFVNVGATRGHDEHWAILARDLGFALSSNQGAWYFALAGMAWGDDVFRYHLRRGIKAAEMVNVGPYVDRPPLGIFQDGDTSCYSHIYYFNWTLDMLNFQYLQYLATTGLGYQSYALKDLTHPRLPKYKVYVFSRSAHLTEEQIRHIETNLQKDGNILIFSFDTARLTGKMEESIRRLTGIKVKAELDKTILYKPLPGAVPTALGRSMDYFSGEIIAPLIYVDDAEAEKLSVFKGNPKLTAAAVKRHKNWTAVYSAFPQGVTAEFVSQIAKEQHVPATAEWGDVVHKGNGMIVIHALHSGQKTIRWEKVGDLIDVYTGKTVVSQGKSYSFKLEAGRSRWFIVK